MKTALLSLLCLSVGGCATAYKDALCKLSQSSDGVATHYESYVASEPDADTKEARQAEAKQFRSAIDEAQKQCGR